MQARGDAQIAGVHKGPQIDRLIRLVGLQHRRESREDRVLTQIREQQPGALAETPGVPISTEQQHGVAVLGIGNGAHAAEGTGAVVQGMGGNGDPGLLEGDALALEPGIGQELMHHRDGSDR